MKAWKGSESCFGTRLARRPAAIVKSKNVASVLSFWRLWRCVSNSSATPQLPFLNEKQQLKSCPTKYHASRLKKQLASCWLNPSDYRIRNFRGAIIGPPLCRGTLVSGTANLSFLKSWLRKHPLESISGIILRHSVS